MRAHLSGRGDGYHDDESAGGDCHSGHHSAPGDDHRWTNHRAVHSRHRPQRSDYSGNDSAASASHLSSDHIRTTSARSFPPSASSNSTQSLSRDPPTRSYSAESVGGTSAHFVPSARPTTQRSAGNSANFAAADSACNAGNASAT